MAIGAVLIALAARLVVPVPGSPVPVTGQSFAVIALGGLCGRWRGSAAAGLYLLSGALGAPVFAAGAAGVEHLTGPTGGYLFGMVVAAWLAGYAVERVSGPLRSLPPRARELLLTTLALFAIMLLASLAILALGAARLALDIGWERAWSSGVEPFRLGAAIKALLAAALTVAGLRRGSCGVLLFLFIPLVLWLLVGQPEPLGWSLTAALVLMLGHRFVARPYVEAVRLNRCVWCCRSLVLRPWEEPPAAASVARSRELTLDSSGGALTTVVCSRHRQPAGRFFSALEAARWPLALGIFVPLLALLVALGAAAAGSAGALAPVTAWFRLLIGLTVVSAATLYRVSDDREETLGRPPRVRFPVHNFFLLGVRGLLWVFRLVGVWWIVLGARGIVSS